MSSDPEMYAQFLSNLTEVKISHELEAGSKISCILITDIIYAVITIGFALEAPGITLAYGRYHSGEWSTQEISKSIMAIVGASLTNWQKNQ